MRSDVDGLTHTKQLLNLFCILSITHTLILYFFNVARAYSFLRIASWSDDVPRNLCSIGGPVIDQNIHV